MSICKNHTRLSSYSQPGNDYCQMQSESANTDLSYLIESVLRALRGDIAARDHLELWLNDKTFIGIHPDVRSFASSILGLMRDIRDNEITLQSTAEQLAAQNIGLRSALDTARERERELTDLYEVTKAITSRLDRDELVVILEEKAKSLIDADVSSLVLLDAGGDGLQILGPGLQYIRHTKSPLHIDICEQQSLDAATLGEPRYASNIGNCEYCRFRELAKAGGVHHMLSVPLRVQDRIIGAINVFRLNKRPFDKDDERKLTIVAGAAAIALENSQAYLREWEIADKLQRAIQPGKSFELPGFTVGCDYMTVDSLTRVGGDFYDIVSLEDGKFGIVMADIAGKGIDAAVHTAMVRFTHRGLMLAESDPAEVLCKLNNAVQSFVPDETFVTLFYGVLDTRSGTLHYANAGHDQPIVYKSSENYCFVCDVTGRALGVLPDEHYSSRTLQLDHDDLIVLFTDGITEARKGPDFFGHDRLLSIIADNSGMDSSEMVSEIFKIVGSFAGGVLRDDAGVLVIKAE